MKKIKPCEHNWEKLVPDDETGGIIKCTKCTKIVFLEPDDMKKFIEMKKAGKKFEIIET